MGYAPSLFWDSSLGEITDLIESYNRKQKQKVEEEEGRLKIQISLNAVLARQIGEWFGSVMGSGGKITPLHELYPGIFKDENQEEQEKENQLIAYKARMEDFAYRHNARLMKRGDS